MSAQRMEKVSVEESIQVLNITESPLIVNANDSEDGEQVQVYIG